MMPFPRKRYTSLALIWTGGGNITGCIYDSEVIVYRRYGLMKEHAQTMTANNGWYQYCWPANSKVNRWGKSGR